MPPMSRMSASIPPPLPALRRPGWRLGALRSVASAWLGSGNALKNIRAMLKTNQNGGFDCPGCAGAIRRRPVR